MTATPPPIDPSFRENLRQQLRERASEFLTRFNRHDVLMARGVRGLQIEAQQLFRRTIVEPLLQSIGGQLAGFDFRGRDVTPERYPQLQLLLDEINIALRYGYISLDEVLDFLRTEKPEMTHVVLTGRNAAEELIEMADLVTEMSLVKHPFRSGIKAQIGVEF